MRSAFIIMVLIISQRMHAQHCPWDCSGMIQVQTNISKELVYKMKPVLVGEKKRVITDTMYGTGLDTYDRCDFLFYDDFVKYRKNKIALHHWYQYDTVYHFAKGKYIVKYNFCEYMGKKLFLRYNDPYSKTIMYHYVEIPANKRIHIHDYSHQLMEGEIAGIEKVVKKFVLVMDCSEWNLLKKDCR